MTDLICRKTMMRCQTQGMCAPFGGCQPSVLADCKTTQSNSSAAPSPAGVDGDFGWLVNLELPEVQCNCQWNPDSHDKTCPVYLRDRLSDAQAIIDGLRGEVAEERAKVTQLEEGIPRIMEASYQFRQQRDQLAGLLREVHDTYRSAIHWEDLRSTMKRIDTALTGVTE